MLISLHSAWHQSQHSVVFAINNTSITNISVVESESESLSFCSVSVIFCFNSPSASHSCGYPPNTYFHPTAPHLSFSILLSGLSLNSLAVQVCW